MGVIKKAVGFDVDDVQIVNRLPIIYVAYDVVFQSVYTAKEADELMHKVLITSNAIESILQ